MTEERKQEIVDKIDTEGFDYYFTQYGPDKELVELFEDKISAYIVARQELQSALLAEGLEIEY